MKAFPAVLPEVLEAEMDLRQCSMVKLEEKSMARIVRFHQYGDPSVLKIEDLDVPPPAADEVQIEVKSIGLNRAEVMFRTHAYLQEAQLPSRLGYEAAGIV